MPTSTKTVLYFGIYLTIVGATLLLIPNIFLSTIGVATTEEVWIRLAGILIMALSVYYIVAAQHAITIILKTTVYIRCTIILFFSAFVYVELMEPIMLLFAGIDLVGGVWTYLTLKKEGKW
jgi:hypothetical protein